MIYQLLSRVIGVCILLLRREAEKAGEKVQKLQAERDAHDAKVAATLERIRREGSIAGYALLHDQLDAERLGSRSARLAARLENIDA